MVLYLALYEVRWRFLVSDPPFWLCLQSSPICSCVALAWTWELLWHAFNIQRQQEYCTFDSLKIQKTLVCDDLNKWYNGLGCNVLAKNTAVRYIPVNRYFQLQLCESVSWKRNFWRVWLHYLGNRLLPVKLLSMLNIYSLTKFSLQPGLLPAPRLLIRIILPMIQHNIHVAFFWCAARGCSARDRAIWDSATDGPCGRTKLVRLVPPPRTSMRMPIPWRGSYNFNTLNYTSYQSTQYLFCEIGRA